MPLSASILSRLQYQHETLHELIIGLTGIQLKTQVNPGKWSAFENMVHIIAYQPSFIQRVGRILKEENPQFERYVAENDPLFHTYLIKSTTELLEIMLDDRLVLNSILMFLSEEQLIRTGRHPKYGILNLPQWTNFFLLHEAHHLWTILQLVRTFQE